MHEISRTGILSEIYFVHVIHWHEGINILVHEITLTVIMKEDFLVYEIECTGILEEFKIVHTISFTGILKELFFVHANTCTGISKGF